jgi:hypothetical protein
MKEGEGIECEHCNRRFHPSCCKWWRVNFPKSFKSISSFCETEQIGSIFITEVEHEKMKTLASSLKKAQGIGEQNLRKPTSLKL